MTIIIIHAPFFPLSGQWKAFIDMNLAGSAHTGYRGRPPPSLTDTVKEKNDPVATFNEMYPLTLKAHLQLSGWWKKLWTNLET